MVVVEHHVPNMSVHLVSGCFFKGMDIGTEILNDLFNQIISDAHFHV